MIAMTNNLEMHVAHACNLVCDNCSHLSNYGFTGMLSVAEARSQMSAWGRRVAPKCFMLLGGEPTINPRLSEIVSIARECFPTTPLQIITNGYFLHRHPELPEVVKRTGTEIMVTRHDGGPRYQHEFLAIEALVARWRSEGVAIDIPVPYPWRMQYRGCAGDMRPYDDRDPAKSWGRCCRLNYQCMQLHEGKLWKCPLLAYLPMAKRKFPNLSPAWDIGLAYRPLAPEASDDELAAFLARREEPACSLCSADWIAGQQFADGRPTA